MGRPRTYELKAVVVAAKEVFWRQGYEGTSIADLERATGLNRSSLYLAFGTKRGLFDAALDEYRHSFIDHRLRPVERDGAELADAAGFFLALANFFRHPRAQQGCLQVNSMTELGGRDRVITAAGAEFADRFRSAFANSLAGAVRRGEMDGPTAVRRREILTASALGVWIAVRVDHRAAAITCGALASEILGWVPTVGGAAGSG